MLLISHSFSGYRKRAFSTSKLGFIGLGHMGSKMVKNFVADGHSMKVFDVNTDAMNQIRSNEISTSDSVADIAKSCDIVFSMLPNDEIVTKISTELLQNATSKNFLHISCSTVSPSTSRKLSSMYANNKIPGTFVASPVFARPDGIARKEAIWMVAGEEKGKQIAMKLLSTSGRVEDYGVDTGAANVVKLCGNFLIASSIEAIGESMVLAEKNGVDREQVMNLLSNTIFNCLIYKGYGQRVSQRDHRPGGFSLDLGLKDVTLVSTAAREVSAPMPFLSTLVDRYTSSKAKGRSKYDWSAIGLSIAEDAGIDVSKDIKRTEKDVLDNNMYK